MVIEDSAMLVDKITFRSSSQRSKAYNWNSEGKAE